MTLDHALHQLQLTGHAAKHLRNVQAAHGLVRHVTEGASPMWAQPRPDLILIQHAGHIISAPQHVREHHTLPQRPHGDHVRFALIGHPIRRYESQERPLTTTEERRGWLDRQLKDTLTIDTLTISDLPPRSGNRWGSRIVLTAAMFTGTGTITDREAFEEIRARGVGRAKSYGFGLLLVGDAP